MLSPRTPAWAGAATANVPIAAGTTARAIEKRARGMCTTSCCWCAVGRDGTASVEVRGAHLFGGIAQFGVCACLSLAKSLDLSVTGEGVETAAQQAQPAQLGCDRAQGYLFSRPVTGADLHAILENGDIALQEQAAA